MSPELWQAQGINHLFGKSVLVYRNVSQCPVWPLMVQICTIPTLSLVPRREVWHFPLLPLLMELQRAVKSPFSLLRENSPTIFSFPSQDMTSSPLPSSRPFQGPQQAFDMVKPRTLHRIHNEAASTLNVVRFDQLAALCLVHLKMQCPPWLPGTLLVHDELPSPEPPSPCLLSYSVTRLPSCL